MRRLLVMLVGLALLAPASAVITTGQVATVATVAPPATALGGLSIGCTGALASFTGQAYCLDGSHADVMAAPKGALAGDEILFGELQLDGWQVPTRCNGNGVSGKREQLVYVHVKGAPNIAAQAITFLQQKLIPGANGVFERSTAGKRAVRWVTKTTAAGCVPSVLTVTVPRSANTSGFPFYNIGDAVLKAVGGSRADRSYLVMVDQADAYGDCGLGQVRQDSRPGVGNQNNTGGAFAMVWPNCWGGLVAAHELTHTMGAVQPTAPHHTTYGHCWDGRDAMCYADGSPQPQRLICKKPDDFRKLDCNGDDYFALYPKPGSYLAKHWNSATSQFLIDSKTTVLPTRPVKPTGVTVTAVDAHHVRVAWKAAPPQHGALSSFTVLVGATDGGTAFDDTGSYPVTRSLRQVTVSGKVRSALVAVKTDVSQGFAVYGTNGSGDSLTSAIVTGGAGSRPTAITATFTADQYDDQGGGEVSWTGGTSPVGVQTCTAVLVNGVRVDSFSPPVSLAGSTNPNGVCYSDEPTGSYVSTLASTDVLQVYARNEFGVTEVTVQH